MLRRFLLVGLFVTLMPGSITQIAIGTITSAVYLMIQLQAKPYKNISDDYLASASSFSMTMVFLCSIVYKYTVLTDTQDVQEKFKDEPDLKKLVEEASRIAEISTHTAATRAFVRAVMGLDDTGGREKISLS